MSDSNSSSLSGGHIHPEGLKDYDEEDSEDEEHNNHQYLVSRRKNCNEKKKDLRIFFSNSKRKKSRCRMQNNLCLFSVFSYANSKAALIGRASLTLCFLLNRTKTTLFGNI